MSVYTDLLEVKDPTERLAQAMHVVRALTEGTITYARRVRVAYPELSPAEADVVAVLVSRAGAVVAHETLNQVREFSTARELSGSSNVLKTQMCRVRQKYPEFGVTTVWGVGYKMSRANADRLMQAVDNLPEQGIPNSLNYEFINRAVSLREKEESADWNKKGNEWDQGEMVTLRQCVKDGWDMPAMVDELNRSSRAIRDKCRKLGLPYLKYTQVWV